MATATTSCVDSTRGWLGQAGFDDYIAELQETLFMCVDSESLQSEITREMVRQSSPLGFLFCPSNARLLKKGVSLAAAPEKYGMKRRMLHPLVPYFPAYYYVKIQSTTSFPFHHHHLGPDRHRDPFRPGPPSHAHRRQTSYPGRCPTPARP